tara:strand:- start:2646 stop:3002 length:357 start_codon:yes stop_codon:yes gene_type:complete
MNSKLVEGLSGCSGSNKNAIYRQQALTNRLFSEMNKLKGEYNVLNEASQQNKISIGANKAGSRAAVSDMNDKRAEKEKELDDLGKKEGQTDVNSPPMPKGDGGSGAFAAAMEKSADQS